MKKKYDYLVVGAGLFGATFANLANRDGKKVFFSDEDRTTKYLNKFFKSFDR